MSPHAQCVPTNLLDTRTRWNACGWLPSTATEEALCALMLIRRASTEPARKSRGRKGVLCGSRTHPSWLTVADARAAVVDVLQQSHPGIIQVTPPCQCNVNAKLTRKRGTRSWQLLTTQCPRSTTCSWTCHHIISPRGSRHTNDTEKEFWCTLELPGMALRTIILGRRTECSPRVTRHTGCTDCNPKLTIADSIAYAATDT